MTVLLKISSGIDAFNKAMGYLCDYAVLFCCLVSAANAIIRYTFSYSSNAWLEIQWYMFAFIVLMGASYTLRMNEHVRVDLIYGAISERARLVVDMIGIVVFLLPACLYLAWACWPVFVTSFSQGEMSSNAGGLIRWPVKLVLVLGFLFLAAQGLSELIKRIAALGGWIKLDTKYEKPLQ